MRKALKIFRHFPEGSFRVNILELVRSLWKRSVGCGSRDPAAGVLREARKDAPYHDAFIALL